MTETSNKLLSLSKKLGQSVEKSRPYYEIKEKCKRLENVCQEAALKYQRANRKYRLTRSRAL